MPSIDKDYDENLKKALGPQGQPPPKKLPGTPSLGMMGSQVAAGPATTPEDDEEIRKFMAGTTPVVKEAPAADPAEFQEQLNKAAYESREAAYMEKQAQERAKVDEARKYLQANDSQVAAGARSTPVGRWMGTAGDVEKRAATETDAEAMARADRARRFAQAVAGAKGSADAFASKAVRTTRKMEEMARGALHLPGTPVTDKYYETVGETVGSAAGKGGVRQPEFSRELEGELDPEVLRKAMENAKKK